jgi:hypothetical protein
MEHYVLTKRSTDLAEIQGQADGNLVLMADSGEIHLRTDAVSRLSVNSTGNVAIGTSGDTSATERCTWQVRSRSLMMSI